MSHRAGLSIFEKRKIAFSCRDSNPECPGHSLGAILNTLSPFLRTVQYNEAGRFTLSQATKGLRESRGIAVLNFGHGIRRG